MIPGLIATDHLTDFEDFARITSARLRGSTREQ